jgi:hypothetical protein
MNFLFSLLRIKGLYIFRALFAHFQEVLHKRHVVYCVNVMSVGCSSTQILVRVMSVGCTGIGIPRWFYCTDELLSQESIVLRIH